MGEPQVYVCRVNDSDGPKHYVTLLPPEIIFSQGLAAEAIVGVLLHRVETEDAITPENFARNRVFVEFLHSVIAQHGPEQPGCKAEAARLGNGWVCIIDRRTATPDGAVPPEDIVGGFEARNGEVVPGSYLANPNHRILTERGFFRLGEGLQECLLRELASRSAKQ